MLLRFSGKIGQVRSHRTGRQYFDRKSDVALIDNGRLAHETGTA
jgi:hypothetical protein